MIVAIHAFENTYGGLHGIEHYLIIEVDNIQQAEEWASEESREVMESYSSIMEDFADSAENDGLEPDTEEYSQYIEECVQENIGYQIWEVIDCYDTIAQMEKDFYNNEDEFVKTHCKELG